MLISILTWLLTFCCLRSYTDKKQYFNLQATCEIYQILPMDLLLGDAIPSRMLATSMALVNKLSNPPIAGDYMRKFPLLPKLLQHR